MTINPPPHTHTSEPFFIDKKFNNISKFLLGLKLNTNETDCK